MATITLASTGLTSPTFATGTRPHDTADFTFGVLADAQYCDCDTRGTRYYRDSLTKLAEATDLYSKRDAAFTIQLGDIIDRDPASFDKILPVYERVEGPRYHVLGNHDFPYSSDRVVARLGMTNEYYDFSRNGWRFVVLDTNDISLYANEPGTPDYEKAEQMLAELRQQGAPNAQTWNGAVGEEQLAWLHETLADAKEKGEKAIVFGHMPVHGSDPHNAWDDKQIREVLTSAGNVAAYLNGHNHAGGYALVGGVHFLNLRGMVEGPAPENAYSEVRVTPRLLVVDGFGREPDRQLVIGNG